MTVGRTPAQIRANYVNSLNRVGEAVPVTIRAYSGVGQARTYTDYVARARITGFNPRELEGSIDQDDNKVIILAEDLEASGMVGEIKRDDRLICRGREYNVEAVDYNTRRVQGVLIAAELRVRG